MSLLELVPLKLKLVSSLQIAKCIYSVRFAFLGPFIAEKIQLTGWWWWIRVIIIDPGEVSKTIFVTTIFACFSNSSKIFEVNLNHNLHLFTSCCCFHTSNFIDNYSDQTLEKHRRTCFSLFSYHLYHNSTALPYVFISGYYLASSQSTKY